MSPITAGGLGVVSCCLSPHPRISSSKAGARCKSKTDFVSYCWLRVHVLELPPYGSRHPADYRSVILATRYMFSQNKPLRGEILKMNMYTFDENRSTFIYFIVIFLCDV